MLLLRLDLWAEKSGKLSGTQFGFRKGKGTTDCLAVLKNQVLVAFLDITGAYDNVLIHILCREHKKEGVPVPLVFFLWDMMWEKHLYFFFFWSGRGARAIRVYTKSRFYLHSCTTFTRASLWLVCTLCARFCNMQMIWSSISRKSMLRLLRLLADVFGKTDDLVWGPGSFIVCKQVTKDGFFEET
jgi:hypothetical protein